MLQFSGGRTSIAFVWLALAISGGALAPSAQAEPSIRHAIEFSSQEFERTEASGGVSYSIRGGYTLQDHGAAALPAIPLRFVIPRDATVGAALLSDARWVRVEETEEIARVGSLMSSDGESTAQRPPDALGKTGDAQLAVVSHSWLHGYQIVELRLLPMRLNSAGALERLETAQVELELQGTSGEFSPAGRRVAWPGVHEADARSVTELVRNPSDAARFAPPRGVLPAFGSGKAPTPAEGQVDWVAVTVPDLVPEFERLAEHRRELGLRAAVVTTDWVLANHRNGGDLQETLRGFLAEAYANWGLRYAVLGGDADLLAPRYARSKFYPANSYTDIPTDAYFACLDGNWDADSDGIFGEAYESAQVPGDLVDLIPELAVGRAPVRDLAQASTFVDKVIEYERPTNPQIHGNALFMSEVLFPSNWNGVDPVTLDGAVYSEDIIFDSIIGGVNFVQSWRLYENFTPYIGATEETLSASLDSLNTGNFGLVTHVGHGFYYNASVGDGNIFVSDAKALTNGPNYFWLHALNCSSGAFDFDCLLEAFVQNPNGGSVLSIGASRSAFPSTADYFEQFFFEELFVNNKLRVGDAMHSAKLLAGPGGDFENAIRWTHFGYTLLGDSGMRLWRETPKAMNVANLSNIPQGATQLSISASYGLGGDVVGASAVLTDGNGNFIYGLTDGSGDYVFELGGMAAVPGTLELHVSGQTVMPYVDTITVDSPTGVQIDAALLSVDDDLSGASIGDGDGLADAGETLELFFDFTNNGDGTAASGLSGLLRVVGGDGFTTVLDSVVSVGNLAGAASSSPADPCVVALDPLAFDGAEVELELDTTDGVTNWKERFTLQLLAPQLAVTRVRIDDSNTGNNDGVMQNGETVELFVELTNFGAADVGSVTGVLSSASGNVSITDPNNDWTGLGLKSPSEGAGAFELSESDTSVENWMTLDLTDEHGRVVQHVLELREPGVPLAPAVDTSISPTSIALRMAPPASEPHFAGYRVYRSDSSGGPYSEITETYLETTGLFEDSGLAPLTRYYYMVSAVDSSLVEGGSSPEVDASTAPPEMAGGFPLVVGDEIVGPVAVGDMRGDGTLVAGYAADFLYAVDSNGQELVDGDLDSQTLGPLFGPPSPDNKWTPSGVSMADLDNDGDVELIGSNWQTFEIYVLQDDGSVMPGWPKAMNNKSWAVPAIGDLDNDGDLEIVVNNVGTWTYVWHHDGSDFFDGDGNPGTIGKFHQRVGENFNRSTPALYDVDGDGTLEILFGTHQRAGADNFVHALKNDATDAPGWGKNLGTAGYTVTSMTIADMDLDGIDEIVFPCDNDSLYVWEPDGSLQPGFPIPFTSQGANRDAMTPAVAFADFDGDSDLEMVVVSVVTRSRSYMHVMDHDGVTRPGWPVELAGLTYSSPIVGDVNGDFVPDIIMGIGGGGDGKPNIVYGFNQDATPLEGFPISLNGAPESPQTICDFDLDGDVDIVSGGLDRLLHVWDMPFPYHPSFTPWPTFQGNNRRTGVYLEDVLTASGRGSFVLSATRGGLVVRALWEGALPADARFRLERREETSAGATDYVRLRDDLRFEDGQFYWVDEDVRPGVGYSYRMSDGRGAISFESRKFEMPVTRLNLAQNIPNPFNPSTTLVFTVPGVAGGKVPASLSVYDLSGRRVRTLHSGPLSPGEHSFVWNGRDDTGAAVSSGTYFAVLRCAGEQRSAKMSLLK